MSRIEEMIKTLCPEGVERVKLGDCCEIIRGQRVTKSDILPKGKYPVISGGVTPMGYMEDYNREANTITISQYGTAGYVDFQTERFWANDICYCLYPNKQLNNIFLLYALKDKQNYLYGIRNTDAIPYSLPIDLLKKVTISLPPLAVQQEIVSVLDSFTTLIDKIKKEVELRKKQMEYYREKLMSPRDNWEIKTLGEIGTFTKGTGLLKSDFREMGFPCIHYGQIHTYYNTVTVQTISFCEESYANKLRKASYGDLLIATTSEDVEACCKAVTWLGKGEVAYSGDSHCFSHNQDPKFVAYLFQTEMFAKQKRMAATGAKVVRVSGESMATFSFAFPPLTIQHSIVRTLDAFEGYISRLEKLIALREKQYEYYREKLLTFE